MKVAVLDVDGTLFPGSLGFGLARRLAAQGAAIELTQLEQLLASYRDGHVTHEAIIAATHRIYSHGMAGLLVEEVRQTAAAVWRQAAGQVFDYARPLISRLTAAGFRVLLISGSPAEIVAPAAADLGAAGWYGASLRTEHGRYLPEIVAAPGIPGGKLRALHALTAADPESFADSLAVGNATTDIELLERVRHPYAFEPDQALRKLADTQGWPIVERTNALARISTSFSSPKSA
jgi:HAD superfamily phosphoserine phosphatase-like hydrolase